MRFQENQVHVIWFGIGPGRTGRWASHDLPTLVCSFYGGGWGWGVDVEGKKMRSDLKKRQKSCLRTASLILYFIISPFLLLPGCPQLDPLVEQPPVVELAEQA